MHGLSGSAHCGRSGMRHCPGQSVSRTPKYSTVHSTQPSTKAGQVQVASTCMLSNARLRAGCNRSHEGAAGRAAKLVPCRSYSVACASYQRSASDDRGRDVGHPTPPAQIRTCPIKASGSYLGCLAAKRAFGHGWRILGFGRKSSASFSTRSHRVPSFWLRRRSVRLHSQMTCALKSSSAA